jgi:hypothetical protein
VIESGDYVVQQGDCIGSIAFDAGHIPATIWNHGRNAEVKRARRDSNVLHPGDKVYVPPIREKRESCASEARHTFKLKGVPAKLRIRLLRDGVPQKNLQYELTVDGKKFSGTTDGDGRIEHSIPPNARQGTLTTNNGKVVRQLRLGHLNPKSEISGVQHRLKSLGYYKGGETGEKSDELKAAILKYQKDKKLQQTGEPDDIADTLKDAHGS